MCIRDRYIYAFGSLSCEVFYNAGNATGSVLSTVKGASFSIGALNQYSILQFQDTIVFIGVSSEGGTGVYMLDGGVPKKISTHLVDSYLSLNTYVKLNIWSDAGKTLVFLSLHNSSYEESYVGFFYDPELNLWTAAYMNGFVPVNQTALRKASDGTTYTVVVNDSSGEVLYNYYSSTFLPAAAVIGPIGDGTPHSIKSVQLIGDGFGASDAMSVSVSVNHKDRSTSWATDRTTTMQRGKAYRLGYSRSGQSRLRIKWQGSAAGIYDMWLSGIRVDLEKHDAIG